MIRRLVWPRGCWALQGRIENLGPMDHAELREAILRPADKIRVKFEPGLVDILLDSLENRPRQPSPSAGLYDSSDLSQIDSARSQKIRPFFDSIPEPRFTGWDKIVLMYGDALGLDSETVSALVMKETSESRVLEPQSAEHRTHETHGISESGQRFPLIASAGALQPALANIDHGSAFGVYFNQALSGAAEVGGLLLLGACSSTSHVRCLQWLRSPASNDELAPSGFCSYSFK
jgi:hypothetical protein